MDSGLLVVRVVFGLLLIGHGTQKLAGWFGGHGLAGTAPFFHGLGFRPAKPMAIVAGGSEALGGALLALGLLSPLAAAMVVGTMLVAGSVHADKGLWAVSGGYEMPLLYGVVGAAFGIGGAGSASLDHAFGLDDVWSTDIGLVAVAVGLALGAAVILRAHRIVEREAEGPALPSEAGPRATSAA